MGWMTGVQFSAGKMIGLFSLHHRNVPTGFGTHRASYPRGTEGSYPGNKATVV